ncbi:MAG: hypothetical protein U0234_18565 [Sandaracinus sp.]
MGTTTRARTETTTTNLSSALALALLALGACGPESVAPSDAGAAIDATADAAAPSDAAVIDYTTPCDHVDPTLCLLPWPSSVFLVDDPSTATGRRVAIPAEAMPLTNDGTRPSAAPFSGQDGFSPATSIVISFPGRIDATLLSDETRAEETLSAGSTTVLVDASTGMRVAHFAELDGWDTADLDRNALYLRPVARLRPRTRYVVGIRALRHEDGSAVPPSAYFAALRDGTPLPGADLDARRPDMDAVFTTLEGVGVARGELIAAWSFETGSDEAITRDLLTMRDRALGVLGDEGLGCTVTRVQDASAGDPVASGLYRRIEGTFTMPSFLVGTAEDVASSHVVRDGEGLPAVQGNVEVPFVALVPESVRARVAAGGAPGRLVVYGHGILGDRFEVDSEWMTTTASQLGLVIVAADWWGMSRSDLGRLVATLGTQFDDFGTTQERLRQGITNVLGLTRSFRGRCAELAPFAIDVAAGGTAPAYDASRPYYYGNSMGAILGGALAGVMTDVDRYALGVGGGSWSFLVTRSDAWRTFGALLGNSFDDALVRDLMIVMTAPFWDPIDAISFAPHLVGDPLPGSQAQHVMMQIGIGDVAVSNAASYLEARTAGIPMIVPSVSAPYGVTTTSAPASSAMTVFALPGVDPIAPGSHDPGMSATHNGVRSLDAVLAQLDAFFAPDGAVTDPCTGACDPD